MLKSAYLVHEKRQVSAPTLLLTDVCQKSEGICEIEQHVLRLLLRFYLGISTDFAVLVDTFSHQLFDTNLSTASSSTSTDEVLHLGGEHVAERIVVLRLGVLSQK